VFSQRLENAARLVECRLDRLMGELAASGTPPRLIAAMRHAALGGGKRLRPFLVLECAGLFAVPTSAALATAAALECVHCYSLVHDDLPAMDNDDLRRGRPTVHKAFDEATAILVGDALQVLAFRILAVDPALDGEPQTRVQFIDLLSAASGTEGMAGGQAIDLGAVGRKLNVPELEQMHERKTGALIRASVLMPALAQRVDAHRFAVLDQFARRIGLAFQVQDDILDVEGDSATVGKPTRADSAKDKPTYPSIVGLEESKRRCRDLHAQALDTLRDFGPGADNLRWLADFVIERDS
jgi:farnesyl diphosphate synthase